MCQALEDACKNADLFIVDAALPKDIENNLHSNSSQIGAICERNGVKKVILSHLTPLVFNKDIVSDAEEMYSGLVSLATDLSSHEL